MSIKKTSGLYLLLGYALFIAGAQLFALSLTGDTSEPRHSLFIPGQQVVLYFFINDLAVENHTVLYLDIEDEQENNLSSFQIPVKIAKQKLWQVHLQPGNEWKITVFPEHKKLGFYKVKASLSSGELLEEKASRPAGYLTYAIIPDPSLRKKYAAEESFFGMLGAFEPGLLGQSWQVHNYNMYSWMAFETESAEQFEQKVKAFEAEEARGGWATMPHFAGLHHYNIAGKGGSIPSYSVYPLGRPPYWAAKNESRTHNTAALTEEGEMAFHNFCTKIGEYMAKKRAEEKIHYYLPTVEPQIPWGYKGSNEDLVRILEIAYKALHAADPNALVAGPGFGLDAIDQLEEMLRLGLANHIDVLDFHPYMGGDVLPAEFNLVKRIRDIRELVQKYAGKQLPMTGTEAGYNATGENKRNWLRGAWSDIQHNLILLGEGFWFNVCFHGADNSRQAQQNTWGHFFNLDTERDYGIQKASPKPVVAAYAAMSWLLEGYKSAGAIDWLGEGVYAYVYERNDAVIMAVWSDHPQKIEIPVAVAEISSFDWMGNESRVACPKGILALQLDNAPHYIKGLNPEQWRKDGSARFLFVQDERQKTVPGARVKVTCLVKAPENADFRGILHFKGNPKLGLSASRQEIFCLAGKAVKTDFNWQLDENAPPAEYALAFVLLKDEQAFAGASSTLSVEPSLNIVEISPALDEDKYGVNVLFKAAEQKEVSTIVEASLPGVDAPLKKAKLKISAGAAHQETFFWTNKQKAPWNLKVKLQAMGPPLSLIREFDFCPAAKMTKPALIDGDLADWQHIDAIKMTSDCLIEGEENWQNEEDFSANIRFAWTAEVFFIACEVIDEQHFQQAVKTPFFSWDDSVRVAINLDPNNAHLAGGDSIEGGILKRWHEFLFARHSTDNTLKAIRSSSYDLRFAPAGTLDREQLPMAIKRQTDKTIYELAIPWKLLGQDEEPRKNSAIGIAILIKDTDVKEGLRTTKSMQLFSGLHNKREIEKFGWVILKN